MAQARRPSFVQLILGGLFAFLFTRLMIGLVRALAGASSRENDRDVDASAGSASTRARRPPRIDRSTAIDVPFTEIPSAPAAEPVPADTREAGPRTARSG